MGYISKQTFKKIILGGLAGIVLIAILIQLLPYGRSHTNPPVIAEPVWDDPQTRVLFMRACGDCHSNETAWPWYTSVAPISWLIQHDVDEGREKFNVSEWGQGENEAGEAAETLQKGSMPPKIYLPIHPSARLSAPDKQALIAGLIATFGAGEGRETGQRAEDD